MGIDPELLKQLLDTFKSELDEQAQVITDGLLKLEIKDLAQEDYNKTIEAIFRSAHNIKGASRSLGIVNVGEIAHAIETLFSTFKNKTNAVPAIIIDLCLEAVDKMHSAMQAFVSNSELSFNLAEFLQKLQTQNNDKKVIIATPEPEPQKNSSADSNEVLKYETIRVTINQIDRISALMEEMQVNKIAIDDLYAEFHDLHTKSKNLAETWTKFTLDIKNQEKHLDENVKTSLHINSDYIYEIKNSTDQLYTNMRNQINELSTLSNTLQEEIRMLRLVPAANLFSTMPRYVRDMAHDMKKEIELTVTGADVKLDKMVLDGIKDPIIHILRNAVDHGIENTSEREAKGKSAIGHITINLKEEENRVLITISDDGAGIDIKKISNTILNKNLLTQAEYNKLNESEILDYIFHPGFSTKEIITEISGRGVGLNVVKSNLESLKGNVTVKTELGKGTTFCLSVPFTITSERGLMIKCGGELFVIPTSHVERVFTIKLNDIINIQGSQAVMLNDHPVVLHSLASLLLPAKNEISIGENLSVIIITKDKYQVGFLVDEVIGEREIIIKPLQYPFTALSCIAGGTLSGSSRIILVLNSSDILAKALHKNKSTPIAFTTKKIEAPSNPHILVVDDSITTRTLEKNVLESKNYQVTVAVNGQEAWDLLQKQKFSLLITDINMPVMDGFTLTEQVKKNENTNYLPVIIVTSLGSDAEKKRGIEAGADAYIVKNEFESSALLEIVSQLV